MKIKHSLALFSLTMTMVMIAWNNAEAQKWNDNEEKHIWNEIKELDQDISNSNEKLSGLHEAAGLVENHINVKPELRNDLNALLDDIHTNGSIQISGELKPRKLRDLNIDAVVKAIAHAETGNGRTGSALTHNNICGQMTAYYKDGVRIREYIKYDSYTHSFNSCKWLLQNGPTWADTKYMDMTIEEMANLWTGADREENWINNVNYWYDKYK